MKPAYHKPFASALAFVIPFFSQSQVTNLSTTNTADAVAKAIEPTPYQDPIFYMMCFVALILLIFILQLSKLFSAVASNYIKKEKTENQILKTTILLIGLNFISNNSSANDMASDFFHNGFGSPVYNALAVIIISEISVVLYYGYLIRKFLVKAKEEVPYVVSESRPFWDYFNKSVAVEKEAAILTDHNYDGIQELDNSLPPWWKYGFYFTIVFAVIYLFHYHVFATGPLMIEELQIAELKAAENMEAMRKLNAALVDETTVKYLSAEAELASGKLLFTEKTCIACHGQQGQGGTGPNLTDDYWIHGGKINDIFKTIKYGVPDKGMLAWANTIPPSQIALLASYIQSMRGTNPPNPKEPQGIIFTDTLIADTPQIAVTDSSLQIASERVDTIKK